MVSIDLDDLNARSVAEAVVSSEKIFSSEKLEKSATFRVGFSSKQT